MARALRILVMLSIALALPAASAAPAAAITEKLEAPGQTAESWIDFESTAARTAITDIGKKSGNQRWINRDARPTDLGVSTIAPATPGAFDLRVKITHSLTTDVIITFVDEQGNILRIVTARDVTISDTMINDGWVYWADFDTARQVEIRDIANTGSSFPWWWIGLGVALVIAATATILSSRRREGLARTASSGSEAGHKEGAWP